MDQEMPQDYKGTQECQKGSQAAVKDGPGGKRDKRVGEAPNHLQKRLVVFGASALSPALVVQLGYLQRRGSLQNRGQST